MRGRYSLWLPFSPSASVFSVCSTSVSVFARFSALYLPYIPPVLSNGSLTSDEITSQYFYCIKFAGKGIGVVTGKELVEPTFIGCGDGVSDNAHDVANIHWFA